MTRDEAVKIAAQSVPLGTFHYSRAKEWAECVVARADALLAAMGEPKACEHTRWRRIAEHDCWRCEECNATSTQKIPTKADDAPDPSCCAATEARVVAEIVAWIKREYFPGAVSAGIERGDWRAKGPR